LDLGLSIHPQKNLFMRGCCLAAAAAPSKNNDIKQTSTNIRLLGYRLSLCCNRKCCQWRLRRSRWWWTWCLLSFIVWSVHQIIQAVFSLGT